MYKYFSLLYLAATAAKISAFSIPKKQHISVSSSTQVRKNTSSLNLSLGKQAPGSELFPKQGSSYIPSGLTKEQWEKIQQKEKGEQMSKDFAAWGPRFQKSDRPDGDWMVLPKLWTGGYEVSSKFPNRVSTLDSEVNNDSEQSSKSRVLRGVLSLVYVYTVLEVILASAALLFKKKEFSLIVMNIMKLKKSTEAAAFSATAMWKLFSMNLGFSIALCAPIQNALKNMVNKMQGSTRIAKVYFLLGNVSVAAFASFALTMLTKVFV
ncbi:hypothetical protein CTEN210_12948 [Chaetoceros tenuissimus]|uniref:Uncharacterized protein n=1 Tax=Chaetoceros tenuissimus TaxID=426638 RepID=A0AAD3D251_9STRA|nr:hypothetical protein CTEN210_12948 [Chaetoceros tenuissimus]